MNKENYKELDIIAIGDITTDVFIKIKEAEEKCDPKGDNCKLCLSFGNKIPYESAEVCYAVGNSANVAVSASRLGLKSALMSNVGNDENGSNCLDVLKKEKVDATFIKIEKDKPTNYHYVLWYDTDRTILVKHEKYNYEWTKTKDSKEYHPPLWAYLSSLSEDSLPFHKEIASYLKRHIKVKLAFSPGTFQIKLGTEALKEIYERTEVFLCNHEEAKKILKKEKDEIIELLKKIHDLGPKIVVITNGLNGSYAFDGVNSWHMKALPQIPVESTGAGDAYSSAFICALFYEKNIEEAMIWGSLNAMSVVTKVGPQKGLLTKKEIEEKIKEVGEDYRPIKIN